MRRRGLVVLAATLALALAGCDWPMFRSGAARTGFTPDRSISLSAVSTGGADPAWTGRTTGVVESSPAVVHGVVYVGDNAHKLYAFDASGTTNCSGSPKSCAPLWTATRGGSVGVDLSSPAVVNGVVYIGSADDKLYAFDASGATNCSGSPKTCAPLWTATTGGLVFSSPAVVNGIVYVGSDDDKLYAFDASGTTNCSGSPKVCRPLWTATTGGVVRASPAVAGGIVYVGSGDGKVSAFDAAGATNCSGSPKTCVPLWTAATAGEVFFSSPAVASGVVYVGAGGLGSSNTLYAFDAAGKKQCSDSPKVCHPLWTATTAHAASPPAVAGGVVYVGTFGGPLYAFDAAGRTGCSGAPKMCAPLWTAPTGAFSEGSSAAVANGVVYIGSGESCCVGQLLAFDAAGTANCSGTPKTCTPVWRSGSQSFGPITSSPVPANRFVYVGDVPGLGGLLAFRFG
jgi:outer membrane protein assembly factor BamB